MLDTELDKYIGLYLTTFFKIDPFIDDLICEAEIETQM